MRKLIYESLVLVDCGNEAGVKAVITWREWEQDNGIFSFWDLIIRLDVLVILRKKRKKGRGGSCDVLYEPQEPKETRAPLRNELRVRESLCGCTELENGAESGERGVETKSIKKVSSRAFYRR